MIIEKEEAGLRALKTEELDFDLVIVGGGLAGTCGAVTAAREGLKVALVQDRPVLGGNSSSEVRLWVLGATSHMGNNNRWAREGGVINEVLEENLYRNRQGNALIFDTILLEKCVEEENLTLLLNTAVYEVEKSDADTISGVRAFCSQNSTRYELRAPLFCDASGDGIVGFQAGAAFRMGAESKEEFGELFAPDDSYGELLGHSIYFYSKDIGEPVKYTAPSWALKDITKIPRYRQFNANMQGCNFWWIEYGGRLDTIHQTEEIKWELWKVVYGVWDHIKNSGQFPEAETMTLEWVGHVPGKRESRRFEGDYMIRQQDVVEQTQFDDVVAHGGWAVDLHPADGVYSEKPGCTQWHSKGVYGIPYRCYYSRNISNLFLAGRIISASHVAFGSTRVMATCAAGAQAVAVAATICREKGLSPREVGEADGLGELQTRLQRLGQYLPGLSSDDEEDLVKEAKLSASSELKLERIPSSGSWTKLENGLAMLLPLELGNCPRFGLSVRSDEETALKAELCRSKKPGSFTPDEVLSEVSLDLAAGEQEVALEFATELDRKDYYFVRLLENPLVDLALSEKRYTGILCLSSEFNRKVATSNVQSPPEGIGVDTFEFWLPKRRPEGQNLAMTFEPPLTGFGASQISRGPARPVGGVNAWVADPADESPELELRWSEAVEVKRVVLEFDPDWDHAMESVLMTHPEEVVPFMVKDFELVAGDRVLAEVSDYHGARFEWKSEEAVQTDSLSLRVKATHGAPAAVFRFRVF